MKPRASCPPRHPTPSPSCRRQGEAWSEVVRGLDKVRGPDRSSRCRQVVVRPTHPRSHQRQIPAYPRQHGHEFLLPIFGAGLGPPEGRLGSPRIKVYSREGRAGRGGGDALVWNPRGDFGKEAGRSIARVVRNRQCVYSQGGSTGLPRYLVGVTVHATPDCALDRSPHSRDRRRDTQPR